MKLSRFILNSESATLAEVGVVDITLTIPANFTANAVRETVVPSPIKNALFRFYLTGGVNSPSIDSPTAISRTYNGIGIRYYVTVYRKDDSTIALACMTTDGRSVTGTSATTIHAKVHLFESPFGA